MSRRRLLRYIEELESLEDDKLVHQERDHLTWDWRYAEADAKAAYKNWAVKCDPESYAVYRAYADQADAAQDVLAASGRQVIA
jgi:hypothetical protein